MVMMSDHSTIRIAAHTCGPAVLLVTEGVLDSRTYRQLRDVIIKAALDVPAAVLVDVSGLVVPASSAWSVFTSARWHVSVWPDVPILLICADAAGRAAITANGVARYVPVYAARTQAFDAISDTLRHARQRARADLLATQDSPALARALVRQWLIAWAQEPLIPVATTVASAFVDNVLEHTESAPSLIVESRRDMVTIAVEDRSRRLASRHEDPVRGAEPVSGLAIVSALCKVWGCSPTPIGKTVWGVVGPENVL
jgi:hypothetical protein